MILLHKIKNIVLTTSPPSEHITPATKYVALTSFFLDFCCCKNVNSNLEKYKQFDDKKVLRRFWFYGHHIINIFAIAKRKKRLLLKNQYIIYFQLKWISFLHVFSTDYIISNIYTKVIKKMFHGIHTCQNWAIYSLPWR